MPSLERAPGSCVKIAVMAAAIACGVTYGVMEYAHRSDKAAGAAPENAVLGRAPTPAEIAAAEKAVTPEEKRKIKANEHYLAGVKYLQDSHYELAREEFKKGKKLDPANGDIKSGLERVEKILAP